jgi:hypothetical protein
MPTPEQMHKLFEAVEATARYVTAETLGSHEFESEDLEKLCAKALNAQLDCTKSWCG